MLSDAINDQLRTVLGPSGKRPAYIAERVKKTWELGDGWVKHVTVEVALGTREGSSVRGGDLGGLHDGALADAATVDKVIDAAVAAVGARQGVAVSLPSAAGGGGGVVDSAALGEFAEQVTGRNGVLASAARLILGQLGLDTPVSAPEATDAELIDLVTRRTRFGLAAFGGSGVRRPQGGAVRRPLGQRPRGPGQAVGARRERDRRRLAAPLGAVRGRRTRRRHAGHLVAGQGPGRGSQRPRLAVRACRGRRGEPGQGSLHRRGRGRHRRVQGIHRRVGGGPVARRRCDGHRDDVQARRRPVGVLPHPVPRQRPLRREAVGGARQHGVLHRHRRAGFVGRHRADRKPWAAVDSPQGRPDADAAVPVRGAAGGRRSVRRRVARRDGDEGAAVGRAAADRRAVAHRRGT